MEDVYYNVVCFAPSRLSSSQPLAAGYEIEKEKISVSSRDLLAAKWLRSRKAAAICRAERGSKLRPCKSIKLQVGRE